MQRRARILRLRRIHNVVERAGSGALRRENDDDDLDAQSCLDFAGSWVWQTSKGKGGGLRPGQKAGAKNPTQVLGVGWDLVGRCPMGLPSNAKLSLR
jgi:hypothetical protein